MFLVALPLTLVWVAILVCDFASAMSVALLILSLVGVIFYRQEWHRYGSSITIKVTPVTELSLLNIAILIYFDPTAMWKTSTVNLAFVDVALGHSRHVKMFPDKLLIFVICKRTAFLPVNLA